MVGVEKEILNFEVSGSPENASPGLNLFIISIIDLFKVGNKTYKSYAPFKVATINKHANERQKKMKRTGHSNI